jgi:hypothetical protein
MIRAGSRLLSVCVCAAALIAAGCGGSAKQTARSERVTPPPPPRPPVHSHYSPQLRAALVRGCEAAARGTAGAAARCGCTVSYLEAHVPQRTLETTERTVLEGTAKEPDWMLRAIVACQGA